MTNPLETFTDPSFTSSAKGLMTLFCIGLIHVVIGVDLEDVKIAIPWFPIVTFEHPERKLKLLKLQKNEKAPYRGSNYWFLLVNHAAAILGSKHT